MAAPSTGVTWVNSGRAVLVREYAGSATDLSPGGMFGSPFALDGQIRNDLHFTTPVSVSATNWGFRVDELTLALALINADNNQLRRELTAIRIERNTFRAEAMTA